MTMMMMMVMMMMMMMYCSVSGSSDVLLCIINSSFWFTLLHVLTATGDPTSECFIPDTLCSALSCYTKLYTIEHQCAVHYTRCTLFHQHAELQVILLQLPQLLTLLPSLPVSVSGKRRITLFNYYIIIWTVCAWIQTLHCLRHSDFNNSCYRFLDNCMYLVRIQHRDSFWGLCGYFCQSCPWVRMRVVQETYI